MDGMACITKIVKEKREEPVPVYNFHVKEWASYFVGEVRVYVYKGSEHEKEIILPKESTHDVARNTLLKEVDQTGAFNNGSDKYIGRLKSSYGYNKQIDRQSPDGKIRWRLDFDKKIGVHYNFEDFSNEKGANAIKKVIPIDISYKEYKRILDSWN